MITVENNNHCFISGTVVSEPEFSHEVNEEKFNKFSVKVERLSGTSDIINVLISERLMTDNIDLKEEASVYIKGHFRSYNNYTGVGSKLILSVFVKDISNNSDEMEFNTNIIMLTGFLCKDPVFRVTPFGREITDILLAVNRIHNKSDYIPCIVWGRNAKIASEYKTGDKIKLIGRIQSRDYKKRISEEEFVIKTAFEVSVSKIDTADVNTNQEEDE